MFLLEAAGQTPYLHHAQLLEAAGMPRPRGPHPSDLSFGGHGSSVRPTFLLLSSTQKPLCEDHGLTGSSSHLKTLQTYSQLPGLGRGHLSRTPALPGTTMKDRLQKREEHPESMTHDPVCGDGSRNGAWRQECYF